MRERTIDRYATCESIWISLPTYIQRRTRLEDYLLTLNEEQLGALRRYIILGVNTQLIKDERTAKTIKTIIEEIEEHRTAVERSDLIN